MADGAASHLRAGAPGRVGLLLRPQDDVLFTLLATVLREHGATSVYRLDAADGGASFWARALWACDRIASRFLAGSRLPAGKAVLADARLRRGWDAAVRPVLDTLVVAGDLPLVAGLSGIAETYRLLLGTPGDMASGHFGLTETLQREPIVLLRLDRIASTGVWEPFADMAVQAHRVSATRTGAALLATLPHFLDLVLRRAPVRSGAAVASARSPVDLGDFLRHVLRLFCGLLERALTQFQWMLAILPCKPGETPDWSKLTLLDQPLDRTWADPFLVRHDGQAWLFFEEAPFKAAKGDGIGHIAAAPIGPDGFTGPAVTVLDLPWHLSYPNVFEHDGSWYMIPESGSQGSVELYRCTSWPDRWTHHATLLEGYAGYDASLMEQDGGFRMFVARRAPGASSTDFLDIFQAPSPLGPWRLHPASPVVADVRSARPAGRPFRDGGHWVRPAQDSSGGIYGRALRLQEIEQQDDAGYRERTRELILPNQAGGIIGIHSFARLDDFVLVDVCRKVPRSALLRRFWRKPPRLLVSRGPD